MLAALALLAGAGQAADTELGSRLKPRLKPESAQESKDARARAYRLLECGVNLNATGMRRVLEDGTQKAYDLAMGQMERRRGCNFAGYFGQADYTVYFGFDSATMRGMIAEAFVKKQDGLAQLAANPMQAGYQRPWHAITTRPAAVDEMATCVAETNPAGIASLLATGHGAPEEGQAMRGIAPSLGTCLGAGAKLTANRTAIRAALAEALYHRIHDAPETGAGVAN